MIRVLIVGTGSGSEYGQKDGQKKQPVKESKCDDKKDHLEEGDKDVGWRNHESNDTKDRGYCSLKNWQS